VKLLTTRWQKILPTLFCLMPKLHFVPFCSRTGAEVAAEECQAAADETAVSR
jgi:hypothetical protein